VLARGGTPRGGGRGKRLCFLGVSSPYGDAGLEGLEAAARSLGVTVAATARYNQGDTSFTGPVTQLRDASCDAVFMATFSADTGRIVAEAQSLRFTPQFAVQATGWDRSLATGPVGPVVARSLWVMGEGPEWGDRTGQGYDWRLLVAAGAVLAFGSDAPVEPADPLHGLGAATGWRRRAGWHPELAVTRAQAVRACTWGAAYAAGMEDRLGRLAPGLLCDLTVVNEGRVAATVVGGEVTWRRA